MMRKAVTSLAAAAAMLAAGATLVTGGFAAPAAAQMVEGPEVNWKVSLWGKRRAFTEGIEWISEQVAERTGGKFTIKLFYGEQLSKSRENLDGISVGSIEGAFFCTSYHPAKTPPLNVLALPFLPIPSLEAAWATHEAVFQHPVSREALAKWNAHLYMSNVLPQNEYMGRGKAPMSVADFDGMRVRALGGLGDAAKLIGATPTTVPAPEVYTALQRGTVDAAAFPFTYAFAAFKVDEIADWSTTNMALGSTPCPTVFNLEAWNALPSQYQNLLNELKGGAFEALKASYAKADEANLKRWRDAGKIEMIELPESGLAEFQRVAGEPLWKQWVEDNKDAVPAQELLDLVLSTAKKASM